MKLLAFLLTLSACAAERHLVVAGLGGEPEYETRFTTQAQEAHRLLGPNGVLLTGRQATREALHTALANLAKTTTAEDTVLVLLIGHGTSAREGEYKFNLPGPDPSAADLKAWLDPLPARQLLVLATSASGAAQPALKAPNRLVLSATRSGNEKNLVLFPRFFLEALRDPASDSDKSESLSAAEVYSYTKAKVANFYEVQKRIATEHPQLEDAPLAARLTLLRFGAAQKAAQDPAKRRLLSQKESLEAQIDHLKREKAALPAADYRKQLTALLVQLAQLQEELDK